MLRSAPNLSNMSQRSGKSRSVPTSISSMRQSKIWAPTSNFSLDQWLKSRKSKSNLAKSRRPTRTIFRSSLMFLCSKTRSLVNSRPLTMHLMVWCLNLWAVLRRPETIHSYNKWWGTPTCMRRPRIANASSKRLSTLIKTLRSSKIIFKSFKSK